MSVKREMEYTGSEIAIIGMSGRFPGARNLQEYWDNLRSGKASISFFTDEELLAEGIDPEIIRHPNYVKAKGILEDIDLFDPEFFDYTPREAEVMDPQFRLLHECSWEALEQAGYDPKTYKGAIGLYTGAAFNSHWFMRAFKGLGGSEESATLETAMLNLRDYLATLVSYKLNLKGPSFTVQTACSTSLVAVHLACQALLSGECSIALAGGVSIQLPRKNGYFYQEGMINSPDGHCRAFDEQAAGTVFGDGAGMVVLKTLEDALEDGDHVFAIIKGSAINNDGNRKVGYSAPSTTGQVSVIRAAHHVAEVEPESISYIEAHGTGTTLGDPIEIEALKTAFQTDQRQYCGIGSVKSNIGHLNNAAGVAGLIKAVLALVHKAMPPTLHYQSPNPKIDFVNSPFYVNNQLKAWTNDRYPLRAGVSSFGIGGTNAHVVLEEAPMTERIASDQSAELITISARSEAALDRMARRLSNYIRENPEVSLKDMAYTLQVGRASFPYRRSLVCTSTEEAAALLADPDAPEVYNHLAESDDRPIVFMFSGQGSQYVEMGRELYEKVPIFRDEVKRCLELLSDEAAKRVKQALYPPIEEQIDHNAINQTDVAQPVIFIVEYAIARMMLEWGFTPQAMIGHSIGEYVAACISGVFSLKDALSLVVVRGQLMQSQPSGAMLSVPLSEQELLPLLSEDLALAAVNAPSMCVVSGTHEAIDSLAAKLEAQGHDCRKLHTSHAFHSAMMDPILKKYEEEVGRLTLNRPTKPFISNVTGTWIRDEEATSPAYWARHLRCPVRFADGLATLLNEWDAALIELGGGNALTSFANMQNRENKVMVHLLRHPKQAVPDMAHLLTQVGRLWGAGVKPDWRGLYKEELRYRIPLPTYPFERGRFWLEDGGVRIIHHETRSASGNEAATRASRTGAAGEGFALVKKSPGAYTSRKAAGDKAAPRNPVEKTLVQIWQDMFGIEEIGINEDFFEIGGHSLKATSLIARIHKELHVELALSDIFAYPTIQELAQYISQLDQKKYLAIKPVEPKPYYRLSSAQKRTFLIHQQIGQMTTYNMPMALTVTGRVDADRFEQAYIKLIQRHENMRTSFHMINGEPMQQVHDSFEFKIARLEANEEDMQQVVRGFIQPFDLGQAPLIRAALVQLAPEKHVLLMDMHNIVSDGSSMNVFIKEFSDLYAGKELSPLRIQYKDYAEWQHDLLEGNLLQKQEEYWLNQLRTELPLLHMPTDFERPEFQSFAGRVHKRRISKEVAERLDKVARSQNVTINVLLFHLYTIVLHKYTGQQNLIVGSLVAGRRHADVESLIGMFTNFLPIRVSLEPQQTVLDQLLSLNETIMSAYENQDYPFDRMVEKLTTRLTRGRNPLFDTMMIFHNEFDEDTVLMAEGLTFENYEITKGISKLDFKLDIGYADDGGLLCALQYNTALFIEDTMVGLMDHLIRLIDLVLSEPNRTLGDIRVLTEEEHQALAAKQQNIVPEPALELVVAATFTADPIQPYLDWWGKQFGTRIDVRFAPYNQVFQELLDPDSLLSTTEGAGMLLVRFEDWLLADESSEADQRVKMEHVLSELIEAISAANRRDTPLFAGVLPVTAPASFSSEMISYLEYLNDRWKEELEKLGKLHPIHVIDFRQADRMYAVTERYDAVGDQAAHLPFTPQFNAVMGTFAARHLLAWQGHPFKVIAVDCDNTLWQGVCGEDGCDGVQIQESSRMLQQFLLSKQQEGMLLVLVSKNNEQDVWQVFESHPDMLLSKEHFVAWRLNWQAKSHNLQQLAEEIGVGLDTFVFIDDNELECAEVQARCPEVLTLQLPQERELGPFLEHLWALDRFRVTEEDKQRTSRYITERERLKAKASLPSLQHFLNELKLVVSVNRVRAEQLPRIAQLTQRINQFTLQANRYTEAELYALLNQPDTICWAVEAADRFGSYGLSGAVITRRNKDTLYLDAFLLSCRVLGRGVEQAVLSALKPYFLEEGINYLEAAYMKTGRNVPMLDFLISGSWLHTDEPGETLLFRQKVEDIPDKLKGTTCIYNAPLSSEADPEAMKEKRDSERGRNTVYDTLTELAALEQQANQLEREALVTGWEKQLHRCQLQPLRYAAASRLLQLPLETGGQITRALYCAPDNEIEEALVQIWERILAVKKIGVDDDFFHLGGNSLYAIQVEIEMEKQGLQMESQHLFKYRTIKQLSPFIQVSVMD